MIQTLATMNKFIRFNLRLFSIISLILELGCTTEKIADYQPASAAPTEQIYEKSGIALALDPFVERNRTLQYFDLDAAAGGVAILHVRVTNQTPNQTFLVQKKA